MSDIIPDKVSFTGNEGVKELSEFFPLQIVENFKITGKYISGDCCGNTTFRGFTKSSNDPIVIKRLVKRSTTPNEITVLLKLQGVANVSQLHEYYYLAGIYYIILHRPARSVSLYDYIDTYANYNKNSNVNN